MWVEREQGLTRQQSTRETKLTEEFAVQNALSQENRVLDGGWYATLYYLRIAYQRKGSDRLL